VAKRNFGRLPLKKVIGEIRLRELGSHGSVDTAERGNELSADDGSREVLRECSEPRLAAQGEECVFLLRFCGKISRKVLRCNRTTDSKGDRAFAAMSNENDMAEDWWKAPPSLPKFRARTDLHQANGVFVEKKSQEVEKRLGQWI
jgi:hypothetical protein